MYYTLKPKTDALPKLLNNIDWLDVYYILQTEYNTSYNTLLLCMNMNLLPILYKYDQHSPDYETDQTDVGHMECLSFTMQIISDNVVKFNIRQKFVRCFSYYKEESTTNTDIHSDSNGLTTSYISLYPNMFLDYENSELKTILTDTENDKLLASRVLQIEYNTQGGYQLPVQSDTASKSIMWPDYLNLFSFIDIHTNYSKQLYALKDNFNDNEYEIKLQYDSKPGEDKYSNYAKTFNIINDSTVIMDFEIYMNIKQFKYMIDINDINILYHVNINSPNNTISLTNNYDIDLYEKIEYDNFIIGDIIYFKNVYTDTVVLTAKIINITNNTLTLSTINSTLPNNYTIIEMDKFIVQKIRKINNFKSIQDNNNLLTKLIKENIIVIDDINFDENDYLALNNLG